MFYYFYLLNLFVSVVAKIGIFFLISKYFYFDLIKGFFSAPAGTGA